MKVDDGANSREVMAGMMRVGMGSMMNTDLGEASDSEILDAILYHLFPAFAPWAGVGQPLVYRWRPGATEAEVYRELCRIVEDWLALFRRDGRPLPPPTAGRNVAALLA